uniref:Transmembrane protein 238 n=1 Tax=Neogobius melanostomus TaxID=47308 RepID=A0A8C6U5U0_9GOBI
MLHSHLKNRWISLCVCVCFGRGFGKAIGACLPVFIIAVVLDITGIVLLFVGIFANLRKDDRFYGDFLIYTGSIVLFFSLGLWLMWYLGNVPAPYDHAGARKGSSIAELARKLSRRLSEKLKSEVMGIGAAAEVQSTQPGLDHLSLFGSHCTAM